VHDSIADFNSTVLWIIVAITIFVMALLAYVVWRFRENGQPHAVAHQPQHHPGDRLDGAPGADPLVIAIPSFRLIYFQDRAREAT
jgi:cytochrome c oxidase subunit 2